MFEIVLKYLDKNYEIYSTYLPEDLAVKIQWVK